MKLYRGQIAQLLLVIIFLFGVYQAISLQNAGGKNEGNFNLQNRNVLSVIESSESIVISASFEARSASEKILEASSGVIITDRGDHLLVLVNKQIRLPETYEPSDLVFIEGKVPVAKSGLQLRQTVISGMEKMISSAKKAGVGLVVTSAFRSFWGQFDTFSQKTGSTGLEVTESFTARPGHSQHQLGTTIDFLSPSRKAVKWLERNSYKFGFVLSYPKGKEEITGYIYEPWHYRFIGQENAQEMKKTGLILEEYLRKFGVW